MGNNFSTFGVDNVGNIYIAGITSGTIYRISYNLTALNEINNYSWKVKVFNLNGSGEIRIETTDQINSAKMHLELLDVMGVHCFNSISRESIAEIDISFLPKGIYFLSIMINGQSQVHKFIKG